MKVTKTTVRKKPQNSSRSKSDSKPTRPASLGPVEDLQSYVKAEWWKDIFNASYLRTDGDVVEDENITSGEVDRIIELLKPAPDAAILDLCCGQGRHSQGLAKRGFTKVTGLDRSHYLITRARKTAKAASLELNFKEGDARKLPFPDDHFDFVLVLGNSFGYFESASDDTMVLTEIRRILKPTGQILLDITDGEFMRNGYEPRSWEWIDKNYFVCRERCLSDDQSRLISREVITHVKKGVIADQFYAERLYSGDQLRKLLTSCKFKDSQVHDQIATESARNQDLGMMGQRIIYTSKPDKEWSVPKKKRTRILQVAVIMGDPSKTDTVKPNGQFDDDDISTIQKMHDALKKLEGREFTIFNNHNSLIDDFRRVKTDFDYAFNLCDEGFNNLATQELHVPALMEVQGIPYTGGNPQCLAYCFDKSLVRGVANEMDIPVPQAFLIRVDDPVFRELSISFPVIVKPNFGDSSVGITKNSVCNNIQQLEAAILEAHEKFGYNRPVLVEQFLTGKDISVGIIGNSPDAFQALPIIEEDYSDLPAGLPKICGYEAKWDPTSPYWAALKSIPANLPDETEAFLVASCQRLFERLECRDYARFDWRLDSIGTPRLLEVNPNPGWCWDGHLAKMAKLAGIDYSGMLGLILESAETRIFGLKKRP